MPFVITMRQKRHAYSDFLIITHDKSYNGSMKIVKEKSETSIRHVTLRLSEAVMLQIDSMANEAEISRQKLIEAILEQALADKAFVVRIKQG
jgi:predicted DNA binding CopG/RHH family protein